MRKKIISILLVAVMVLLLLPMTVFAEDFDIAPSGIISKELNGKMKTVWDGETKEFTITLLSEMDEQEWAYLYQNSSNSKKTNLRLSFELNVPENAIQYIDGYSTNEDEYSFEDFINDYATIENFAADPQGFGIYDLEGSRKLQNQIAIADCSLNDGIVTITPRNGYTAQEFYAWADSEGNITYDVIKYRLMPECEEIDIPEENLIKTSEEDEELSYMRAKAAEWVETYDYLNWMPEEYINLSMTEEEKVIYDISYNDHVLDITLKGKQNGNEKVWKEAWRKAYLNSSGMASVSYNVKFGEEINKPGNYVHGIGGNGDDFYLLFSNINEQEVTFENCQDKGFGELAHTRISFPIAQVSREKISNELTIIPNTRGFSYQYVNVINEQGTVSQSIFLVYIHCEDDVEVCELSENNISDDRISLVPLYNDQQEMVNLALTYDEEIGVATLHYSGISTDPDEIKDEIHIKNQGEDHSEALISVTAPEGYYYVYPDGTRSTNVDFGFRYILYGEINRSSYGFSVTWENDAGDIVIEKFQIRFDAFDRFGRTWMDDVAEPIEKERIKIKYKADGQWVYLSENDLKDGTNMEVEYVGENSGLLHIGFPNNKEVTSYRLDHLCVEIAPKDDIKDRAIKYSFMGGSSDGWANPDPRDTEFALRSLQNVENFKTIEENGYPSMNLNVFRSFEWGNSIIYYTEHSDGNEVIVVFWYDENNELLGSDYLYNYVDDYLWVLESNTYENEDDVPTPINMPVVVGKGLNDPNNKIKIQLFPQEGEGYYLKIVEKGGWATVEGEKYTVFFPYHYFGLKNYLEAKEATSIPIIYHLTNANTVKEELQGEYTKHGVKFVVEDFSPFYTEYVEIERNFVLWDKDGKEKEHFATLLEAIEAAEATDIIFAGESADAEFNQEKVFRMDLEDGIRITIKALSDYEIFVNGKNEGSEVTLENSDETLSINIKEKTKAIKYPANPITIGENTPPYEENPNTGAPVLSMNAVIASMAGITFLIIKKRI